MSSLISSSEKSTSSENPDSAAGDGKETPYPALDEEWFEVTHSGWNSEEEMLLREGVEMFGLDNWDEVAGHVWAKTKDVCMEHYRDAYISSPESVPDSTQVLGKDKIEVVATGKDDVEDEIEDIEDKMETLPKSILGDEDDIWSRAYVDAPNREELVVDMGVREADPDFVHQLKCRVVKACRRRAEDRSRYAALGDEERDLEDKTETLPKSILGDEDDIWSRAYVDAPKREELVVDRGVKEADPDFVHQLKCRVVKAYRRRAEDRSRYAALGDEERELCQKYDECLRFDSDEEHKQVIESLLAVHRFQKRKAAIKEARAAGCRTIAEFNVYHELIKEREAKEWKENSEEERASSKESSNSNSKPRILTTAELTMYLDRKFKQKQKQAARRKENSPSSTAVSGSISMTSAEIMNMLHLERKRKEEEAEESARGRKISLDPASWSRISRISPSTFSPRSMTVTKTDMNLEHLRKEDDHWKLKERSQADWSTSPTVYASTLLPHSEKPQSRSINISLGHYLKIQEQMTKLIMNGHITQKSDSYRFFEHQISPARIDKIYDLLTKRGIAPPRDGVRA